MSTHLTVGSRVDLLELLGPGLYKNKDRGIVVSKIFPIQVLGLFFGGEWCKYCPPFSEMLKEEYKRLRCIGCSVQDFDVIYCSGDERERDFQRYYAKMPWLALPYDHAQYVSGLIKSIPTFVLVKVNQTGSTYQGTVISVDGVALVKKGLFAEFLKETIKTEQEKQQQAKEEEEEAEATAEDDEDEDANHQENSVWKALRDTALELVSKAKGSHGNSQKLITEITQLQTKVDSIDLNGSDNAQFLKARRKSLIGILENLLCQEDKRKKKDEEEKRKKESKEREEAKEARQKKKEKAKRKQEEEDELTRQKEPREIIEEKQQHPGIGCAKFQLKTPGVVWNGILCKNCDRSKDQHVKKNQKITNVITDEDKKNEDKEQEEGREGTEKRKQLAEAEQRRMAVNAEEQNEEKKQISPHVSLCVQEAANYVYEHSYSKPYDQPDPNQPSCFSMDIDPVHGVQRPNHGLANAVRKAACVPLVADLYNQHYNASRKGALFQKEDFEFTEEEIEAMQIAMLFEVSGRKSDIGFSDDTKVYLRYHKKSCENFREYAESTGIRHDTKNECLKGLENMYCKPEGPKPKWWAKRRVFEVCHDLDLFRCYDAGKMEPKLDQLGEEVTPEAVNMLVDRVLSAILSTGDRLVWSPVWGSRDYDSKKFPEYSKSAAACMNTVYTVILRGEKPKNKFSIRRVVPGEAPVRFCASRFKIIHAGVGTMWKLHKLENLKVYDQNDVLKKALFALIDAYVETTNNDRPSISDYQKEEFKERLYESIMSGKNKDGTNKKLEDKAVLLWTSLAQLNRRELCSIINQGLRSEGSFNSDGRFEDHPMQKPAVLLASFIQIHLNRHRRGCANGVWPGHQSHHSRTTWTAEPDTLFRGSSLPEGNEQAVLEFYENLADNSCTGKVYRVPGLLATSMFKGVANTFMGSDRMSSSCEKVLYIVLLCRNRETGKLESDKQPNHLAFIDFSETPGEYEFLFSAYSAFRVHSVKRSSKPTNMNFPHEITIVACLDNQDEDQDVPSAPWH